MKSEPKERTSPLTRFQAAMLAGWGPFLPGRCPRTSRLSRSSGKTKEKATRIMSLAMNLRYHSRHDQARRIDQIFQDMGVYGQNCGVRTESEEKMFDRDKACLGSLGMSVEYRGYESWMGDGYTIAVKAPDIVPSGSRVDRALERWFHILHAVETDLRPTVEQLAEYLGVDRGVIHQDINAMRMATIGPLPHQYINLTISDDGTIESIGSGIWR